jgi:NADH-quinone oxidoreductase subunit J
MVMFYLFAGIAVVASLLVIAQKNPIYSVMLLIASFGALSGLYVLLDAPFVAVTQIIVYAGAIMVLFLFVVMLLNAPHEDTDEDLARIQAAGGAPPTGGARVGGALLTIGLLMELAWALGRTSGDSAAFPAAGVSSVRDIGRVLFTDFAFPFEVTSVLILVAMLGAVLLARRRRSGEQP